MKTLRLSAWAFLLCAVCLFCACGPGGKAADTPKAGCPRVVSLAPALTELVSLLKPGCLVGRTIVCDHPASVKSLPTVGAFGDPSGERVLSLKPDLIVANVLVNPRLKEYFGRAGCKLLLKPCENMSDYEDWVRLLGAELHAENVAQNELDRLNVWRKENGKRASCGMRILFLLWDDPVIAAGSETLPDTAIRLAGGVNVLASEKGYFKASPELLLKGGFDGIVWAMDKAPETSKLKLPAVPVYRNFDQNALLRPGPRFTGAVDDFRVWLEQKERRP